MSKSKQPKHWLIVIGLIASIFVLIFVYIVPKVRALNPIDQPFLETNITLGVLLAIIATLSLISFLIWFIKRKVLKFFE